MYRITKGSKTVALVEEPCFIRLHENGCFVRTDEEHAEGIAVSGTPYNLPWKEPMEGVTETAAYSEVNGGEYILRQDEAIGDLEALAVELAYDGILTQLGLEV